MKEPEDIIENMRMVAPPDPYAWLIPALAALAILLVVGGVVFYLYRKRKLPFQEHPPIPAHIKAFEALDGIRHLLGGGDSRAFVIEVSKILRHYIEDRFALRAPRLSTEEFLLAAEESDHLNLAQRRSLSEFLTLCDRVKFALGDLDGTERQPLYDAARGFVEETKETAPAGEPR